MLFHAESSESKGFDDRMLHENQLRHVYGKGRHVHSYPFYIDVFLVFLYWNSFKLALRTVTKQNFK